MKKAQGWVWPDHEEHLIKWLDTTSPPIINGRAAYQGRKQQAVLQVCRSFDTAIDVGAHVGLWSYNLARAFKHVEAFEPVPSHRDCFAINVKAPNVVMHACALGAADGRVAMKSDPVSSGDTQVTPGDEIDLLTLDSFAIKNVDLIKIDCEGYEENVVAGAVDTIAEWRPTIIVEQKRDMAARFGLEPLGAVKLLESMGYRIVDNLGGDFIMVPK
jgi:FkbM family methyltransferase